MQKLITTLPQITTSPITGSTKVYDAVPGYTDVRVPFREIALSETAKEPPLRIYDSSGPYSDAAAAVDVDHGPRAHVRPGSWSVAALRPTMVAP